jgi:hypothetical protein
VELLRPFKGQGMNLPFMLTLSTTIALCPTNARKSYSHSSRSMLSWTKRTCPYSVCQKRLWQTSPQQRRITREVEAVTRRSNFVCKKRTSSMRISKHNLKTRKKMSNLSVLLMTSMEILNCAGSSSLSLSRCKNTRMRKKMMSIRYLIPPRSLRHEWYAIS